MVLTTTTFLFFLAVSIAAIGLGAWLSINELHLLGVVAMLFTGLMILTNPIAQQVGEVSNTTMPDNNTIIQAKTFEYNEYSPTMNGGIALLLIVSSAGLGLQFWNRRQREQEKQMLSLDVDDE